MSEYELLFDHKQKPQAEALDLPLCTEGLKEGIPGRTSKPPHPCGWPVLSVTLPGSSCQDFICMRQPSNPASTAHGCCVISTDGETCNRNEYNCKLKMNEYVQHWGLKASCIGKLHDLYTWTLVPPFCLVKTSFPFQNPQVVSFFLFCFLFKLCCVNN